MNVPVVADAKLGAWLGTATGRPGSRSGRVASVALRSLTQRLPALVSLTWTGLEAADIAGPTPYLHTRRAPIATLQALQGASDGAFTLSRAEQRWLTRLSAKAEELPAEEKTLIEETANQIDRRKVRLDQYDLTVIT
ncbi:MAG: hypothetical protein WAV54_12215 [Acidimicrobiales bacterium]